MSETETNATVVETAAPGETPAPPAETKPLPSAAETLHQPGQPTASRDIGACVLQDGPPPIAGRAGGPSGRSKYQHIFNEIKSLNPGKGWVKVVTTPATHDKDLAHIRTALKRQGLFNPDVVKVKSVPSSGKTQLCVWIPEGSKMEERDLKAPAK